MQTIRFSQLKLFGFTAFFGVLSALGWALANDSSSDRAWTGPIICIVFGLIAMRTLVTAFGAKTAIQYDADKVIVSTLWSTKVLPWATVTDIDVERTTFYAFGFVPVSKVDYIRFKTNGGMFGGKKVMLSLSLLDLPRDEVAPTIASMLKAKAGMYAGAASHATATGKAAAPSNFDADAVIQRYLADKQKAARPARQPAITTAAARPAGSGFGRRAARI